MPGISFFDWLTSSHRAILPSSKQR